MGNLGAQSKSISSIRIYGRATVTVYENTAFRGHSAQFTSDVADLGRRMMSGNTPWSDHIESLRTTGVSGTAAPDVVEHTRTARISRREVSRPDWAGPHPGRLTASAKVTIKARSIKVHRRIPPSAPCAGRYRVDRWVRCSHHGSAVQAHSSSVTVTGPSCRRLGASRTCAW